MEKGKIIITGHVESSLLTHHAALLARHEVELVAYKTEQQERKERLDNAILELCYIERRMSDIPDIDFISSLPPSSKFIPERGYEKHFKNKGPKKKRKKNKRLN